MKLNSLFANNMVLTADKPIRVFGNGAGNVTVSIAGNTVSKRTACGDWCLELPPLGYGGPYTLEISLNDDKKVIENVYIGDVILIAGQSNVQFKVKESSLPESDYIENKDVSVYTVDRLEDGDAYSGSKYGWVPCTRECIPELSALGYHVGSFISNAKGVHVGVIICCQGASVIESWMSECDSKAPLFDIPENDKMGDHFEPAYDAWNGRGCLYNKMFRTVAPYSIKGMVWYQGESDTAEAEGKIYDLELKVMIDRWREDLCNKDLPLCIVQLPDFIYRIGDKGWISIQEAQKRASEIIENSILVTSIDIYGADEIHPREKSRLAEKIAKAVLNWI